MDLSKTFAPGMGYVALSRVKSLSGISLVGLSPLALKVDKNIAIKDEDFLIQSRRAEKLV
jgi:hypothetical protein